MTKDDCTIEAETVAKNLSLSKGILFEGVLVVLSPTVSSFQYTLEEKLFMLEMTFLQIHTSEMRILTIFLILRYKQYTYTI